MTYPDDFINKVICGDCLSIMPEIPDKSIDMILCDLPYGTTACKWDTIIPFEPLWEQYKRIIKDNGAIVLTASQPFTSALVMSNIKMFRCALVWNKKKNSNPLQAKINPLKIHEDILVFGIKSVKYYPQKEIRGLPRKKVLKYKNKNNSIIGNYESTIETFNNEYYPTSILEFSNANKNGLLHPTQKPVALFEYLIKTYTNEGDLVLDNCAGSGTTGVAAINTGRNFIGIEKEEKYCKIAKERLRQEILL